MNRKQRKVFFVIAALIILMFLFPPYVIRGGESGNLVLKSGYGCVLALPQGGDYRFAATVNVSLLLAQIFGVLVVGGIIWFALKDREKGGEPD